MKKGLQKAFVGSVTIMSLIASLVACGAQGSDAGSGLSTTDSETTATSSADGVQTIRIGCNVSVSGVQDYLDENDNLTGATVELMRKIDEKLPDYDFELVPTSFDDVFVGMDTGNYQGGEVNFFLTQERIEKYAIPEENISASYIGILVKKDLSEINSFEDVAKLQKEKNITFYPMQAGNGLTYPVEVYNEEHPDATIAFEYTSENTNSDVLGWIPNGRYDVGLCLYSAWVTNFENEDGAYHEFYDDMAWIPVQTVGVYNFFNKADVSDEFLAAYDDALKELKEDGTATEISKQFFGYDVFDSDISNLASR